MIIGSRIIQLSSVDSTNNYAAKLIEELKADEGTAIMASFQESGKGQRGAKWQSSQGLNLLVSVILYPRLLKPTDQFKLSKVASLAIYDLLAAQGIDNVAIKWPNDILVDKKKICGMLIENSLRGSHVEHSIIGMGLNVNQEELPDFACSLKSILGKASDIDVLASQLFQIMDGWYTELKDGNTHHLDRQYEQRLFGKNQFHDYLINEERRSCKVSRVDPLGSLYLWDGEKELGPFGIREVRLLQD